MRQSVEGYGFDRVDTNEDANHLGEPKDRGIHCSVRQAVRKSAKNNAEYHALLGTALLIADREKQAVAAFDNAIALAPNKADHHYNRGLARKPVPPDRQAQRCRAVFPQRHVAVDAGH